MATSATEQTAGSMLSASALHHHATHRGSMQWVMAPRAAQASPCNCLRPRMGQTPATEPGPNTSSNGPQAVPSSSKRPQRHGGQQLGRLGSEPGQQQARQGQQQPQQHQEQGQGQEQGRRRPHRHQRRQQQQQQVGPGPPAKPTFTAADKAYLKPEQRAELARRLRRPRPSATGGQPALRVFRHAIDDLRLFQALEAAGLAGRVVVADSVQEADVVLATRRKRTGQGCIE